jgi:hypothetical protein
LYADDVNVVSENMHNVKKNTQQLLLFAAYSIGVSLLFLKEVVYHVLGF